MFSSLKIFTEFCKYFFNRFAYWTTANTWYTRQRSFAPRPFPTQFLSPNVEEEDVEWDPDPAIGTSGLPPVFQSQHAAKSFASGWPFFIWFVSCDILRKLCTDQNDYCRRRFGINFRNELCFVSRFYHFGIRVHNLIMSILNKWLVAVFLPFLGEINDLPLRRAVARLYSGLLAAHLCTGVCISFLFTLAQYTQIWRFRNHFLIGVCPIFYRISISEWPIFWVWHVITVR